MNNYLAKKYNLAHGMVSLGYLWIRPYICEQLNKCNFQAFSFLTDVRHY